MDSESELEAYPHSPISEKWILSAIFQSPKLLTKAEAEGLDDDCFYLPETKNTFQQLRKYIQTQSGKFDLCFFVEFIHKNGKLDSCGGASAISDFYTYATSFNDESISRCCDTLREKRTLRLSMVACSDIREAESPEEAIERTEMALKTLRDSFSAPIQAKGLNENLEAFLAKLKSNIQEKGIVGYSTGIPEIDDASGGLKAGELWTICGKPSQGKSVLMLQIAMHVAHAGKKVMFVTLEMMTNEVIQRMISAQGNVDMSSLTTPSLLNKGDLGRIKSATVAMKALDFYIQDKGGMTIEQITMEAENVKDLRGLDLLVVDYLQLVKCRHAGRNREQEVSQVSASLKQLAKRLEIPVITGSQLNDDGKTRESRAIEQDSDALIGVDKGVITIGKMRNGRRGEKFAYELEGKYQKFKKVY